MLNAALWFNGFVADYWAIALLTILAGAGIGTQLNGVTERVVAAIDRLAATRGGVGQLALVSDEDRRLVHCFRLVWNLHGREPTDSMCHLFQRVQVDIIEEHGLFLAGLLEPKVDVLKLTRDVMGRAVSKDSKMGPREVQAAFEEMYNAYTEACRWTARIKDHLGDQWKDDWEERLAVWRSEHAQFRVEIRKLQEEPALKDNLRVFCGPAENDAVYLRFMREAEDTP